MPDSSILAELASLLSVGAVEIDPVIGAFSKASMNCHTRPTRQSVLPTDVLTIAQVTTQGLSGQRTTGLRMVRVTATVSRS
jgi:hypothetical protein